MWAHVRPHVGTIVGGGALGCVIGLGGSYLVDRQNADKAEETRQANAAAAIAQLANANMTQRSSRTQQQDEAPVALAHPRLERWNKKWTETPLDKLGFHLAKPHPLFVKHYDTLLNTQNDEDQRLVLFPLCGASVDLAYLARRGHHVVGVDGVPKALDTLLADYGEEIPSGGALAPGAMRLRVSQPGWAQLQAAKQMSTAKRKYTPAPFLFGVQGDFLSFNSKAASKYGFGDFDAAFDRGGLVAVEPADRPTYSANLASLIKPGGRVLLVATEHVPHFGPPFSVDEPEVRRLFGGSFDVRVLSREDRLDAEPVWRERGATLFDEVAYLLTKK